MSDKSGPSIDLATRARWQRWEMESLDALKQPLNRRASDRDPRHQAELARRRTQALAEARAEGLAQGRAEGFQQGHREGHAQGLEQGRAEGHAQGLEQGRAQGHAQGLEQGHAEGANLAREQAARLDDLAQACGAALNNIEQEVGQSIIQLAVRIAEQVLRTHIRDHPNHILDLVREVMQARPEQGAGLRLRLHPEDLELVRTFLQQTPDPARYILSADENITRGGCVAETALGSVDATLETRWQRVIAALGQPGRQS
ncbi:MAG: flagellar assembly protein FliH [Castellaniella sp.]|uniref:flagellar assembly protein FliH n=1 Tax=Castellaniella sp. TaxID=1955812 RepID=UPI002A3632D8|nr:flagellar assembly protein FliH [Castellaniella sp.]MDY0310268.1 flagellar assembly protein FliH [Castellaniella sp.]